MSTGRKKDPVWVHFDKLAKEPGKVCEKVQCKKCKRPVQQLVARMKAHVEVCEKSPNPNNIEPDSDPDVEYVETDDGPSTSTAIRAKANTSVAKSSIESFVVRTSNIIKAELDTQWARALFAINASFRSIEHPEIKKLCEMMRPGYKPPNRVLVGSSLLDKVYNDELEHAVEDLQGQVVCLCLDGWENINRCSIICAAVHNLKGKVFLVDTIDTSGMAHTSDNLQRITEQTIIKTETKVWLLKCCKYAAGRQIAESNNILAYGCSAHILNLLAHDISKLNNNREVQQKVVKVLKFFRNHHLPKAWLEANGGSALVMPVEVRWNTFTDSLDSYIKNWSALAQTCEDHREDGAMDSEIGNFIKTQNNNNKIKISVDMVFNMDLKNAARTLFEVLKPISVALDKMQANSCNLSDAVDIWKQLLAQMGDRPEAVLQAYNIRSKSSLTDAHFAAYLLSPSKNAENLKIEETNSGLEFIEDYFPLSFMPLFLAFKAKTFPFRLSYFSNIRVTDYEWWKSIQSLHTDAISKEAIGSIGQVLTAVASSAGIERLFSTFGMIHSDLRNQLGVEKAAKLVFIHAELNKNI